MTADAPGFVLVGGPPSSGSTLLSVMLDSHPEVFCGPETNLFAHPGIWEAGADISRFLDLPAGYVPIEEGATWARPATGALEYYGTALDDLRPEGSAGAGVSELAAKLFRQRMEQESKRLACEKSPPNIYAVFAALNAAPEMKAIVIVRSAPDVLRSLERRKVKPAIAVHRWLTDTNLALAAARNFGPERIYLVRYEDLIADPRETAAALCRFLDVSADGIEAMVSRSGSNRIGADTSIAGNSGAAAVWNYRPDDPIAAPPKDNVRALTGEETDLLITARLDRSTMAELGLPGRPLSARQVSRSLGYDTSWWRFRLKARHCNWPPSTNRLFLFYTAVATKRRRLFLNCF